MEFDLFIIESLRRKDEKNDLFEGLFLKSFLELINDEKMPRYCYIRTEKELRKFASEFEKSGYRNLFISCHGAEDGSGIATTYDAIGCNEFAEIFADRLDGKRVFFSACNTGNEGFADALFETNRKMKSFISPSDTVYFKSTYALWVTFFYMLSWGRNGCEYSEESIRQALKICSSIMHVPMFYCKGPSSRENNVRIFNAYRVLNADQQQELGLPEAIYTINNRIVEQLREDKKREN